MRLYTPGLPTDYARHVIDQGFVGLPRAVHDAEELDAATRDAPEGEITLVLGRPQLGLMLPVRLLVCCTLSKEVSDTARRVVGPELDAPASSLAKATDQHAHELEPEPPGCPSFRCRGAS